MIEIHLIDENKRLTDLLSKFLITSGFTVHVNDTIGPDLYQDCSTPRILIIDASLYEALEIEVSTFIQRTNIPLILLSSNHSVQEEIRFLEGLANDYLPKPVQPRRLIARIKALTRSFFPDSIKKSSIILDGRLQVCFVDDNLIQLSETEYELLDFLIRNQNKTVSRDEICNNVRSYIHQNSERTIDMRISNLRKKIGDNSPPYKFIKTIRGIGYCFTPV